MIIRFLSPALYIGHNRRLTGQFFRCCTARIRNLDLTNTVLTVKGLDALASRLSGSLESLVSFSILTSDSLKFFCTNFPKLRRLKLSIAGDVNFDILAGATLPDLQSLSLNGRLTLNDENFSRLMANFWHVVQFELCPNTPISIYLSVLDLVKRWPNIGRLSLNNLALTCEKNRSLLRSFVGFKALESLCLGLADLDEADFAPFLARLIEKQSKLRYLNVEYLLLRDQRSHLTPSTLENQLRFVTDAGFLLHINQVRMNRHSPYLYLTKITVRKF